MLKKLAALGVIAGLAFTPVVALAQTDTAGTTGPADNAATAKPMKAHKAHKKTHKAAKKETPAEAPKS